MAMIASKNQNSALRAQIHSNSRSRKATSASCMIQSWQEQAWQERGLAGKRAARRAGAKAARPPNATAL